MAGSNDRVSSRKSTVYGGKKSALTVTASIFCKDETIGETGEYMKAMRLYESRAVDDPFASQYVGVNGGTALLMPDFNPYTLIKLPNECSALRQCVDAMVTNIDSFGYRLEYIGEAGLDDSPEALREKERIESFLEQPNGEYTTTELRERIRRDVETLGYAFTEHGRDVQGNLAFMNHVPGHTIRMTGKQPTPVAIDQYLRRNGQLLKITTMKRFRLFAQILQTRLVYFKEFGDPRIINCKSGREEPNTPPDEQATEIFHWQLYSPGSPYGLPRWVNTLPAIMGNRESELTNLQFFKDNAIPAMAILVSGGALTGDTVSNIEEHFTRSQGRGSMNRVVVLEASGDENAAKVDGTIPPPRLELKPLVGERQTDALFAAYEESNEKKIRASFRLPPLFVGRSDDYSHATADASMVMADAQIFGPERNKEDDLWNAQFLTENGLPLKYWRMRTNPPRLVSADSVLTALNTLDDLGAVTPNIAIGIANELFDLALTPVEAEWGNYPFPLVMQLALANNLIGLEDIMIIPDILERGQAREDTLTEAQTTPDDAKTPGGPKEKAKTKPKAKPVNDNAANAKKPSPAPAEKGPGDATAKKQVAERIGYMFRQVAMRGNDIPNPLMYKTRKRTRTTPVRTTA